MGKLKKNNPEIIDKNLTRKKKFLNVSKYSPVSLLTKNATYYVKLIISKLNTAFSNKCQVQKSMPKNFHIKILIKKIGSKLEIWTKENEIWNRKFGTKYLAKKLYLVKYLTFDAKISIAEISIFFFTEFWLKFSLKFCLKFGLKFCFEKKNKSFHFSYFNS